MSRHEGQRFFPCGRVAVLLEGDGYGHKKRPPYERSHVHFQNMKLLDRSGEKPYCTFIICIRFHYVNNFF